MAKRRNATCRQCEKKPPRDTRISRNGLCQRCSMRNQREAIQQLRRKRGPIHDRWYDGLAEAFADGEGSWDVERKPTTFDQLCPRCVTRPQRPDSGLCAVCERTLQLTS